MYDIQADIIVSAFGSLSILALIYGIKSQNIAHSLIGVIIMLMAYLCKSTVMVFVLAFLVMALLHWRQLTIPWILTMLISATFIWLVLAYYQWDPVSRFFDFDNTIPRSKTAIRYFEWWLNLSKNWLLWGLIPAFLLLPIALLDTRFRKNKVQIIWLLVTLVFLSTGRLFFEFMAQLPFKERFWTIAIFPVLWFLQTLDTIPKRTKLYLFVIITADMALMGDHFRWKFFMLFTMIAIIIWLSKWPKILLLLIVISLVKNVFTLNERRSLVEEAQLIRSLNLNQNDTLFLDRRIYEYKNIVFESRLPQFYLANIDSIKQTSPPVHYWLNVDRHHIYPKIEKLRDIKDFKVLDTLRDFNNQNYMLKIQLKNLKENQIN